MKSVQDALRPTGIPAYATAWKPTASQKTAPAKYMVYTTMRVEDEHYDDSAITYRVYVYLNLWTKSDPTPDLVTVRAAMRAAGFELFDERDSYNDATDQTLIAWTWVGWEAV
ncbi:MAG: hypothetical protein IKN05_01415 [Clostridia bacterium]|nr:hypothetical protein [Clostridia bacterium]